MSSTINIILYYLINKKEISDSLIDAIKQDINNNYSSNERNQILLDLEHAIHSSEVPVTLPGIKFSTNEIDQFLLKLNSKIKE
jgi:hypothetical protein